jgi:hypothetical protein
MQRDADSGEVQCATFKCSDISAAVSSAPPYGDVSSRTRIITEIFSVMNAKAVSQLAG